MLDLQYQAYQSEAGLYQDYSIPPLTQTLEQLESEVECGACLVAKQGKLLVGSVRACLADGVCKIGRLIVKPSYQGQGIGTKLMNEIEAMFSHAAFYEVFTGHKSLLNIKLYKRLGYHPYKEEAVSNSLSLVFLQKPNRV